MPVVLVVVPLGEVTSSLGVAPAGGVSARVFGSRDAITILEENS